MHGASQGAADNRIKQKPIDEHPAVRRRKNSICSSPRVRPVANISRLQACDRMETLQEFATSICKKYQAKVRGLSGRGVQIASSVSDPDRACKVACQDEQLPQRFYIVSGEQGHFPFGTKCSRSNDNRYCVNGKCLQFGDDNIPLMRSYINLAHFRSKRSAHHASLSRNNLLR